MLSWIVPRTKYVGQGGPSVFYLTTAWSDPVSFFHDTKRAVADLAVEDQLLLMDKAGQLGGPGEGRSERDRAGAIRGAAAAAAAIWAGARRFAEDLSKERERMSSDFLLPHSTDSHQRTRIESKQTFLRNSMSHCDLRHAGYGGKFSYNRK